MQRPRQLHSIHGLRFLAALAIVVHHSLTMYGTEITNVSVGAAGVDVFFVISGVVIGYSDHRDRASRFMTKRLIRMMPLYWLATAAFCAVHYLLFSEVPSWQQIVHSLALVPDFANPSWTPLYVPAWSLCFELLFYGLFALALPWAGASTTLAAALLSAAAAALAIPVPLFPGVIFDTSFFLEFTAGLLIAQALNRGIRITPKLGVLAAALGAVVFAFNAHSSSTTRILGWGIPATLVVIGALGTEDMAFWRNRLLVLGGSASYALYVFHLSVMDAVLISLERLNVDMHSSLLHLIRRELILITTVLIIAVLVHIYVEQPTLRYLRRLLVSPAPAIHASESALLLSR